MCRPCTGIRLCVVPGHRLCVCPLTATLTMVTLGMTICSRLDQLHVFTPPRTRFDCTTRLDTFTPHTFTKLQRYLAPSNPSTRFFYDAKYSKLDCLPRQSTRIPSVTPITEPKLLHDQALITFRRSCSHGGFYREAKCFPANFSNVELQLRGWSCPTRLIVSIHLLGCICRRGASGVVDGWTLECEPLRFLTYVCF